MTFLDGKVVIITGAGRGLRAAYAMAAAGASTGAGAAASFSLCSQSTSRTAVSMGDTLRSFYAGDSDVVLPSARPGP